MMSKIRQSHSKQTKFSAGLAMLRGEMTVAQISQKYKVHVSVLHRWRKTLLDHGPDLFDGVRTKSAVASEDKELLERKIGQLTIFKKKFWAVRC